MPFTLEEFLAVFRRYNEDVWPFQGVLILFGIAAVVMILGEINRFSRWVHLVLAILWLWMGLVYQILYFSEINRVAWFFGIFFVIQGLLFGYFAINGAPDFKFRADTWARGVLGWLFIVYALLVYPFLATIFGHSYPEMPTFGLPCPTTIFTFGLLLWTHGKVPWYALVIPFLWSLIGVSAALGLGMWEDMGLGIAGVLGTLVLAFGQRAGTKVSGTR